MRFRILILASIFIGCQFEINYILPAEWEPHKAMMVSFNDNDPFADSVSVEIVKAISPAMKVYCVIMSDTMKTYYSKWFEREGIPGDSIQFMTFGSSFSYSIRDPLFFLKNNKGEMVIANYAWNDYGYMPADSIQRKEFIKESKKDHKGYVDNFSKLFKYKLVSSEMVNEGGAIEVNGRGTVIQVESLNMHRNPSMSLKQQETELQRILGVTNIIWLKNGLAEDPDGRTLIAQNYFGIGVNGHVDEFCRFVNPTTVFLAFPDSIEAQKNPVTKLSYERMQVNYGILKNSTDQNGQPLNIIKFPTPDFYSLEYKLDSSSSDPQLKTFSKRVLKNYKQFQIGDTVHFVPACSYLNYLVTNKLVLIPKYWKEGLPESTRQKDEEVKKLFENHFPSRKIIQISPMGLNVNGGGIHCWTQQILQ